MSEAEHDELDYYTWLGEQAAVPPVPDSIEYVYRVLVNGEQIGDPFDDENAARQEANGAGGMGGTIERSRVEWEAMPEPAGATQAVGVAEGVEDGSP
jgi:hypothetical protein